MDVLEWLQEWYLSQCNGDWEHKHDISISTVDNPGWSIGIDLKETAWHRATMPRYQNENFHSDGDWITCQVIDRRFCGFGDPTKLTVLLEMFRNLITSQPPTLRPTPELPYDLWQLLERVDAARPGLMAGAASAEAVDAASAELGLEFPTAYREFLLRYGGGLVGEMPIFGVRSVAKLGSDATVVAKTRRYRDQKWPGVEEWIIISADAGGNPFGIGLDGRVWLSRPDYDFVGPIAGTFGGFLYRWCLELGKEWPSLGEVEKS